MIRRHSVKHGAGRLERLAMPVQGDAYREIRNGLPERKPYMPQGLTEDQHARLIALLNRNTTEENGDNYAA